MGTFSSTNFYLMRKLSDISTGDDEQKHRTSFKEISSRVREATKNEETQAVKVNSTTEKKIDSICNDANSSTIATATQNS